MRNAIMEHNIQALLQCYLSVRFNRAFFLLFFPTYRSITLIKAFFAGFWYWKICIISKYGHFSSHIHLIYMIQSFISGVSEIFLVAISMHLASGWLQQMVVARAFCTTTKGPMVSVWNVKQSRIFAKKVTTVRSIYGGEPSCAKLLFMGRSSSRGNYNFYFVCFFFVPSSTNPKMNVS